jgi:hypothetical protein
MLEMGREKDGGEEGRETQNDKQERSEKGRKEERNVDKVVVGVDDDTKEGSFETQTKK